mgnify:CR=1 FL=1
MMHSFFYVKLSLAVAFVNFTVSAQGQPSKTAVEAKLWDAIGGKENWRNARYFMFSCVGGGDHAFVQGERKYLWDKQTGNCRFEGITADDETIIALLNIKTGKGTVYLSGAKLDNPKTTQDILEEVSDEFGKDACLLFLPTALEGSQVSYTVSGEKLVGSQRFAVVHIKNQKTSFEATIDGQLYVDTQTGQVQRWRPSDLASHFAVSGFKDIGGGLVLPTRFTGSDTVTSVTYPLAAALVHIEDQKFNLP